MSGATAGPDDIAAAGLARAGEVIGLAPGWGTGEIRTGTDAEGWTPPLFGAAARGHVTRASARRHGGSRGRTRPRARGLAALPIHFAGHSRSVVAAERLLRPAGT
jgi:hypothetical protein